MRDGEGRREGQGGGREEGGGREGEMEGPAASSRTCSR